MSRAKISFPAIATHFSMLPVSEMATGIFLTLESSTQLKLVRFTARDSSAIEAGKTALIHFENWVPTK